jgi:hypothetical protein
MTTKTHHITATYAYAINGTTGRVNSKPRVTFEWHDDLAAWRFLRRAVRGYRGPFHPHVSVTYAKKIQALATATGFKVTVKENPKPTPAEARATIKAYHRQFDPHSTARDTAATLAHFARKP